MRWTALSLVHPTALYSTEQAAVATAQRKIAEVEAAMALANGTGL